VSGGGHLQDDGTVLVCHNSLLRRPSAFLDVAGLFRRFPDLEPLLQALLARITNLLPILRDHYYHPQMYGSWSLKSVLPCLAPDLSYADLNDVQHGGQAQDAYLEAIAPETTAMRKEELRKALVAYCALDTLGLVRIVEVMRGRG